MKVDTTVYSDKRCGRPSFLLIVARKVVAKAVKNEVNQI